VIPFGDDAGVEPRRGGKPLFLEVVSMRRFLIGLASSLILAGCAPVEEGQPPPSPGEDQCAAENLDLKESPTLTVGTSFPYYEPFKSGPRKNPDGFEPDIANHLAGRMGLSNVAWSIHSFESLYAPGSKDYDFSMDQISITEDRAQVVDFSEPYYRIQQGLLVQEGTPIEEASTIDELKQYKFGAQAGTTGLTYIKDVIQPDDQPNQYNDTKDAAQALSNGQIDAVVIDVPIAIPLTEDYAGTTVAAQFITDEGYGMVFEKGSPLVDCVNEALQAMTDDGTLQQLQDEWLPELAVDIKVIEA
jgi:polar amino acid transport system substrate-binding protein